MPTTVNGVGTHYYGKSNQTSRNGTCRACGANTSTRFLRHASLVRVLFVPLVPLGRKRITDQCAVPAALGCGPAGVRAVEAGEHLGRDGGATRHSLRPRRPWSFTGGSRPFTSTTRRNSFAIWPWSSIPIATRCWPAWRRRWSKSGGRASGRLLRAGLRGEARSAAVRIGLRRPPHRRRQVGRSCMSCCGPRIARRGQVVPSRRLEELASPVPARGRHAETLETCKHLLAQVPALGQTLRFRDRGRLGEGPGPRREHLAGAARLGPRPVEGTLGGGGGGRAGPGRGRAARGRRVLPSPSDRLRRPRRQSSRAALDRRPAARARRPAGEVSTGRGPAPREGLPNRSTRSSTSIWKPVTSRGGPTVPVWVINADGGVALVVKTMHYAVNPRPSESQLAVGRRLL